MRSGASAGYASANRTYWTQWEKFCTRNSLDPHLTHVQDPVPFLQIFAHRVRSGDLAVLRQRV